MSRANIPIVEVIVGENLSGKIKLSVHSKG